MARYGHRSALVAVGAGELALGATIHLVENLLVIGLYDGIIRPMAASGGTDSAAGDALWAVASSASVLAFGVLGLGARLWQEWGFCATWVHHRGSPIGACSPACWDLLPHHPGSSPV